ncbi:hypothetical protein HMPREF9439_00110 [Parasutterella excrementihominis YIT 11859]|uniref:Uncharacterized protein n=1 Tax=Parasutterella excrementihominis YIT 11859 TaxID=762966 RepID=F3QGS1_9BURK|nr:hypothetical protein HMPREF9439_00110 [Parasutterella excrementihominis YIT 11859]
MRLASSFPRLSFRQKQTAPITNERSGWKDIYPKRLTLRRAT